MTFYLSDKIQIHPSQAAIEKLWTVSYVCKDVWNLFNEQRRSPEIKTNYYSQKKQLPALKRKRPELKLPSSQVLQEVAKSLNASWQMFFTKRKNGDTEARPPRFKSYNKQDMPPSKRVYNCPECGFKVERDINSVLNFLKNDNYALWQGLIGSAPISIARYSFNPVSGANRRAEHRSVILNYQDARGLLTP